MPYNDSKGPKMESAKQERKDLLRDNPVVRDMDSSRPWMSKHFQSTMGSAMRVDHEGSPATAAKPDFPDIDGDGNTSESMKQAAKDKKAGGPEMKMDGMIEQQKILKKDKEKDQKKKLLKKSRKNK